MANLSLCRTLHTCAILYRRADRGNALVSDNPGCAQAPATFDPLTASAAQLHYYGLPVRATCEPLAHYQTILGYFKHRSCLTRIVNTTGSPSLAQTTSHPNHALDINTAQPIVNTIWAGNMADQPSAPGSQTDHTYHYSEIDSDWMFPGSQVAILPAQAALRCG